MRVGRSDALNDGSPETLAIRTSVAAGTLVISTGGTAISGFIGGTAIVEAGGVALDLEFGGVLQPLVGRHGDQNHHSEPGDRGECVRRGNRPERHRHLRQPKHILRRRSRRRVRIRLARGPDCFQRRHRGAQSAHRRHPTRRAVGRHIAHDNRSTGRKSVSPALQFQPSLIQRDAQHFRGHGDRLPRACRQRHRASARCGAWYRSWRDPQTFCGRHRN